MTFGRAARAAGRTGRMRRRIVGLPALVLAPVLTLGACDTIGNPFEAFGAGIPPPDEFQVIEYEPLVVPESYTLPEPQLGAPSPRTPNPQRQAAAAILGPGAVDAAAGPSAGEQVLLSSANAASASGDIRVQLEQERTGSGAGEEYEAPTLWELFGFGSDEDALAGVDEQDLVDPVAEAERLRQAGVATPVDPEAELRAAEEAEEAERGPAVIDTRPVMRGGPRPRPQF